MYVCCIGVLIVWLYKQGFRPEYAEKDPRDNKGSTAVR